MSNARVLILGGTGFFGNALRQSLLQSGCQVGATFRNQPPILEDQTSAFTRLDILDAEAVHATLFDWDIVVNCTGQVTRPLSSCLEANSRGIVNIAAAVKSSGARLLHVSSMSVYGTAAQVDESTPPSPETPYATAKATAESLLRDAVPSERLTICRLSNLYGPGQKVGVIAYLQRSLRSDRKLTFNNDGSLRRFYVHVSDAAAMVARLALDSRASGIFNLRGPESYSILDLIQQVEAQSGTKFDTRFEQVPPPENIDRIDDTRLRELFDPNYDYSVRGFLREIGPA